MKVIASKQNGRVKNFALAAMLVVSTMTASVPFLFNQKADAAVNDTITADTICDTGINKAVITVYGKNANDFPLWVRARAAGATTGVINVPANTAAIAVPIHTTLGAVADGTAYADVWTSSNTSAAPEFVYDATYNAINCNDYSTVYVSPSGSDTLNDGVTATTPFATIQKAVDTVSAGGMVNVAAGTYNEAVVISKAMTVNGAQAGADARSRTGNETIVNAVGSSPNFTLNSSNVTVDGFTFNGPAGDSAAVKMYGAYSGFIVTNNIINVLSRGVLFNTSSTVLSKNVINNSNAASFRAGFEENTNAAHDVVIDSNTFNGSTGSGDINFIGVIDATSTNLEVLRNKSTNGVGFLGLTNTTGASIHDNTITGAPQRSIFIAGNNVGTRINNNTISTTNVGGAGVVILNPFGYGLNTDIKGTGNNFAGSVNGVVVYDESAAAAGIHRGLALKETADFSHNYWGSPDGPNDTTKTDGSVPSSHASAGAGAVGAVTYGPWYTDTGMQVLSETTTPTVTSESQVYEAAGANGQIVVTLTFSEPIDPLTIDQGWNAVAGSNQTKFKKVFYSTKTYVVSFRDLNGNKGTYNLNVDKTSPTVKDFTQVYDAKAGGRVNVTLTFSEPINPSSLPQGWNRVAGSNNTQFVKAYYSSKSYTITFTDVTGNAGTYNFTVDASAPTLTVNTPVIVNKDTPIISGTASEDTAIVSVVIDGITYQTTVADGVWTVTGKPLADKQYDVVVTVRDTVGNPSTPQTVSIVIDTTAPEVTIDDPKQTVKGDIVRFTGTIEGDYSVLDLVVGGQHYSPTVSGTNWFQNVNTSGFSATTYTATITANDAAGNISEQNLSTSTSLVIVERNTQTSVTGGTPTVETTSDAAATPRVTTTSADDTTSFTGVIGATAADAAVLGATTDDTDDSGEAVKGATTEAAAVDDTTGSESKIMGLAWYWWILILAALAAIAWFIAAAVRRRNADQA